MVHPLSEIEFEELDERDVAPWEKRKRVEKGIITRCNKCIQFSSCVFSEYKMKCKTKYMLGSIYKLAPFINGAAPFSSLKMEQPFINRAAPFSSILSCSIYKWSCSIFKQLCQTYNKWI